MSFAPDTASSSSLHCDTRPFLPSYESPYLAAGLPNHWLDDTTLLAVALQERIGLRDGPVAAEVHGGIDWFGPLQPA